MMGRVCSRTSRDVRHALLHVLRDLRPAGRVVIIFLFLVASARAGSASALSRHLLVTFLPTSLRGGGASEVSARESETLSRSLFAPDAKHTESASLAIGSRSQRQPANTPSPHLRSE